MKRLYFDVALSANPLSMSAATQVVNTRNLFFGSDFPATMTATVEELAELNSIFDAPADTLLTRNARDMFALGS